VKPFGVSHTTVVGPFWVTLSGLDAKALTPRLRLILRGFKDPIYARDELRRKLKTQDVRVKRLE
jgi:hypothetical protein